MERLVKGIWIPIEVWQNNSLCWNEKILLMEIDSFTSKGHDCFMSNEHISNLLGVTERCASKYLSHLTETGFIRIVRFDGRKRYVESTISFNAEWNECSMQSSISVPHNNKDNNIDLYKERDNKRTPSFVKPSISEVREYCQERGNDIDPEEFVDFYESKGWMVGKSKMKDWKASVRTWEKSHKKQTFRPQPQPKQESPYERNRRLLAETMERLRSYDNPSTPSYDEQ